MTTPAYAATIARIMAAQKILIVSHANPDGDAIGSTLALGMGLRQLGRHVIMFNEDPLPYSLRFLPHVGELVHKIPRTQDIDLAILVDCSQPHRAGDAFEKLAPQVPVMIVDHHLINSASPEDNCIDVTAAATGHVVYELLKRMSARITPEIATLVYTTIVMDTGFFRYSNTTPPVFELAAELVRLGASPSDVSQSTFENCPVAQVRLLPLVLETMTLEFGGQCSTLVMTLQMLEEALATPDMAENFINYARAIEGVEVAVLFRERDPGIYKVSFRSKKRVNVAELAARFGGGGHNHAAGCTIEKPLPFVKSQILAAIESVL
jgi:phosphoesterase RecJ-like protein